MSKLEHFVRIEEVDLPRIAVNSLIAISLAVLAAVAVHDSLAVRNSLSQEETSAASCEQSGFSSATVPISTL